MPNPIIMPKFGQMTEESSIVEWKKKEGDKVAKGDVLFTVETDKSVMEAESFFEGTLLKILVQPGVNVPVSSTVGWVGTAGEALPAVEAPKPAAPKPSAVAQPAAPAPVVATPTVTTNVPAPRPVAVAAPVCAPKLFRISPRAAAFAKHAVVDPMPIRGTGPEGRIVEKDVKDYLAAKGYDKLRISPAAKNLAAKENVCLLSVQPSEAGRISVADVERALAERPKPMSKMRQVIGQRLTQSIVTQPHFFVTVSVDMTDLIALRAKLKEQGAPYTVTDFISQAVVLTLQEFPEVNSTTDGKSIRWNSRVHLGVAVSLEQGLVVPVIRGADELTLAEINAASKALAEKARAGKLAPNEMSGSTFTISNMGMLNVENFTAIINTGEAAILAVSSTLPQPVVRDGKVVVRQIMKMTLSSDHRIVDGAMAAKFINAIKAKLEDSELWKRLTS
ncbi:MAG: Dihydrolipoyllysine-residue acetyltransferase component of pyruvate dehydrogenase complex [Verrucomicrobiae bacterium]|nr:Dihydrolipoyllysine-residue acetyltransferase component of pyruvate dehydrogenase complex [Verrucomicrobiae bacterium]